MAAENPAYGKICAAEGTVLPYGLEGVLAARGSEAAARREHRRYTGTVEKYGQAQQPYGGAAQAIQSLFHRRESSGRRWLPADVP